MAVHHNTKMFVCNRNQKRNSPQFWRQGGGREGGENVALEFQASVWGSDKGGKNNAEEEKSLPANFPFVGDGIASSFFLLRIPSIPSRIAQFLHTFLWKKWFVCRCAALQIDAVFFQLVSFWECKVGVGEKKLCPECTHRNARHIVRPRMQTE